LRAFFEAAYPSHGHDMLFDVHALFFAALGIARRGIFDNMRTELDKVDKGKGRVVHSRFATMCAHYLVEPDFCTVAPGWEKAIVEKNVQDSRRCIWIDAAGRRWGSLDELNVWLAARCRELWQEVRHSPADEPDSASQRPLQGVQSREGYARFGSLCKALHRGRVHPLTKDCSRAARLQGQLCGAELGRASGKCQH
jgi:hypothetical protein